MTKDSTRMGSDDVYDKAVKTILQDATPFLIPLINHMFDENFTNKAKIRALGEQGIESNEKKLRRTHMGIHVEVSETGVTKEYVIEVQSTADGSLLVRIVKYGLGAAMGPIYHEVDADGKAQVYVRMPDMGIVYLRAPAKLKSPAVLYIEASEQEGVHHIEILRMDSMTLDIIFEKGLLFLVPFYLFRYANKLKAIQGDPVRFTALMDEYRAVADELHRLVEEGKISKPDSMMLASLTIDVAKQLALKEPSIQKGVADIMSTEVLAWRPEDLREEGRKEGRDELRIEKVRRMIGMGLDNAVIQGVFPEISTEQIEELRHVGSRSETGGSEEQESMGACGSALR